MILADENVHTGIISLLRTNGYLVISVQEEASSIKDEKVIEIAQANDYILLTEDKDFGEWVFAHHVENLSVLFLRYNFYEYEQVGQTLVQLLNHHPLQRPFFATITSKKVRIRQL